MELRQPNPPWPKIAGAAGIVLAIVLTAVIWFQVIDRQANAMRRGEQMVLGTPVVTLDTGSYPEVAGDGERSPMP